MYELHLIASASQTPHHHPDATPRCLSSHAIRQDAHRAGRRYLAEHPGAWLQVQDDEQRTPGEDVS